MIVREVECKSVLNKSKLADYCINPYIGCQHACRYCYAESYTRRFTDHAEPWGEFIDVKINAPTILAREIKRKAKGTVYISSLTDAYQPLERKYELTRKLLQTLLQHQFPITIQTKSALVLRDLDLIRKFHQREVGFTLTSLNDDVRKSFEPGSSTVQEKLRALKELKQNRINTYVFFGPVLPYISDRDLEHYLTEIAGTGVDYIYLDKLNLKPGLWTDLEKFLLKNSPQHYEQWRDTLLGKNDYYSQLKANVDGICKKLQLTCKFCF